MPEVSAAGIPGKLVADFNNDTGEIYWQPSGKRAEAVATLIVGRVKSVDSRKITLVSKSGLSHNLKLSSELSPPSRGERIVAVVKPKSLDVERVYTIADSK